MDLPVSQKNMGTLHLPITLLNIIDFQNSFTSRLSNDCLMKRSLKIPPHLERVATLLVKTMCSKIALISMLTPVAACSSWAFEHDYQFPRRVKRFSYIRCHTTVLVLIDFFLAVIFSAYCVYPNSLCIIRYLHSRSVIISETVATLVKFLIYRRRTALTSIQLTAKSGASFSNEFTVQKCRTWRMWCRPIVTDWCVG